MLAGFKAFWTWVKSYPLVAAIIFLVIVPFALLGVLAKVRNTIAALPGVGAVVSKIPQVGA